MRLAASVRAAPTMSDRRAHTSLEVAISLDTKIIRTDVLDTTSTGQVSQGGSAVKHLAPTHKLVATCITANKIDVSRMTL